MYEENGKKLYISYKHRNYLIGISNIKLTSPLPFFAQMLPLYLSVMAFAMLYIISFNLIVLNLIILFFNILLPLPILNLKYVSGC